jgi:hypothetical protein
VGNQIDSAFGTGNFFEEFLNRAMKDQSKGGTATMLILRKVMLIALFLLLVGVSFAVLWLPVVKMLMRFHSGWNGFPVGLVRRTLGSSNAWIEYNPDCWAILTDWKIHS